MEDVAQVSQIGVVHVEHVKVFVWLGQVNRETLEDRVQVDVVVTTASNDSSTFPMHKTFARCKQVGRRAGR